MRLGGWDGIFAYLHDVSSTMALAEKGGLCHVTLQLHGLSVYQNIQKRFSQCVTR